jgi:hypothetical protein
MTTTIMTKRNKPVTSYSNYRSSKSAVKIKKKTQTDGILIPP